jgi:hypothetical protein
MSATITLDRQAVVDLLAGSYAACNLLEDVAGISADELRLRLDDVTFEALGSLEDDAVAPLWARADAITETVNAS